MANALGIDLGNVYKTGESIKSARRDALKFEQEQEDRKLARKRTNALLNARASAAMGSKAGMRQLLTLDAKEAKAMQEAIDKMDEAKKTQLEKNLNDLGAASAAVLQAPNPQQAYEQMKLSLAPELTKDWPEQFDSNFLHYQLAQTTEVNDYLKGQVPGTRPAQIDAATKEKGGGLKTADVNAMNKMVAGLFDNAIYNTLTGDIKINDKTGKTQRDVQSITTEATRLYQTGQAPNIAAAVTQAARKGGFEGDKAIKDLSGKSASAQPEQKRLRYNPSTNKFE